MRSLIYSFCILFFTTAAMAQNVGIGTPSPQAKLDITATNEGLLIPRVALTSTAVVLPVITGTASELVYNTATVADVTPGFYYLGTATGPWVRLGGALAWEITGNTNIVNGVNYIGTAAGTNVDVAFRRNNAAAGKIGFNSTSFGVGALNNGANTNSTAIGNNALSVSTGNNNVAVGQNALLACNTTAQWNTAVGTGALRGINSNAAQSNTAVGFESMTGAGNISNCVAIGYHALFQNRANNSTAIGYNALQGNTTQGGNTAVGWSAINNSSGSNITALGYEAAFNSTGSNNTCLGYQAGRFVNGGNNNTFVGFQNGNATTGSNNTSVGFQAQVPVAGGSNQVRIGNGAVNYAGVQVGWSITSDYRFKTNTQSSTLGLDFIKTLRPVSYFRNNDKSKKTEYGFIAQELEEALLLHGDANNGIISKDDAGMYAVRYNDFISISVKAIQEQQVLIEELQKTNAALLKRLEALEEK